MSTLYRPLAFSLVIAVVLGLLIGLAACDTGIVDSGPDPEPDPVQDDEPLPELPGDSGDDALSAIKNFSVLVEIAEEDILTDDETEVDIALTELEVAIRSEATVGEVNDLLSRYDAVIVDMLAGRPFISIRVPNPGDLESLRGLVDQIESEENIENVRIGVMPDIEALPDNINPNSSQDVDKISHHLAVRGHAAWNAKNAITNMPWLVIADYFGDGSPREAFIGNVHDENDFRTDNPDDHGYHVLGIINASFDRPPKATGIFPGELNIRAVDLVGNKFFVWHRLENRIVSHIESIIEEDSRANIVVNTSLGKREAFGLFDGLRWKSKLNPIFGDDLEDKFIHFAAAGNLRGGPPFPVYETSSWNYAALGPEMGSRLRNLLAVENRRKDPARTSDAPTVRHKPGCTFLDSAMGSGFSAIGDEVYSVGGDGQNGTTYMGGTSMATPQAAGTAAYMWAVNSSLTVDEVVEYLQSTKRAFPTDQSPLCRDRSPSPIIDTYDAVLAAGGADVRLALLDVTESGSFDEQDIEVFLAEWEAADGMLDYSRYDLNGTGQTGGDATDRFDLNHDISFGNVTQTIEGEEVTFNETAVTDEDVLCYYAYSDLYAGSADSRTTLLAERCGSAMGDGSEIYAEDFQNDPNYEISVSSNDRGSVFEWDPDEQNFYVETADGSRSGRWWAFALPPIFDTLTNSQSFEVSFQFNPIKPDWGSYPGFRFVYDDGGDVNDTEGVWAFRLDCRDSIGCSSGTANSRSRFRLSVRGGDAFLSPRIPQMNEWYDVTITYEADLESAQIEILREDGSIFMNKEDIPLMGSERKFNRILLGRSSGGPPQYGNRAEIRVDDIVISKISN